MSYRRNGWNGLAQYFIVGATKCLVRSQLALTSECSQLIYMLPNVTLKRFSRYYIKMAVGGCFCGNVRIEYVGQPLASVSTVCRIQCL